MVGMPGLFDQFNQAFGDDEESPDVAQRVVGAVIDDDDDVSDELAEAERRLQKAQYYKQIAQFGVVEEDGTQDAAEVNAEVKTWARQRIAALLGVARPEVVAPKLELPFTPQQVAVLIKLAERAMAMGLVGSPTVEPQVKKIQAPVGPQVRKVQTKSQQVKTETKPAPKPQAAAPAPPAPGKKKPLKPQKNTDGEIEYETIPTGEVFRDKDKQLYKFVDNPNFDPSVKNSKPRSKIKVTNQVRPINALPMPQDSQMSAITAAQAMETVGAGHSASAGSPFSPDVHANQNTFIAAAVGALRND